MKYIDSEKLIAEIDDIIEMAEERWDNEQVTGVKKLRDLLYDKIVSLQQEQQKVDLDREIIKYKVPFTDENEYLNETTLDAIAHHFAEWGAIHLNARKEE